MAKPNYAFAKRQRELAKQKKKEEKLKRKADAGAAPPAETGGEPSTGETAAPGGSGDAPDR